MSPLISLPEEFLTAPCRQVDPELFHTDAENKRSMEEMAAVARMFCRECPVLRECAAAGDALRASGLWGGSYRTWRRPYTRRPLIPEAPQYPLPEQAVEDSLNRWVAA